MDLGLGDGIKVIEETLGRRCARFAAIVFLVGLVTIVGHFVILYVGLPAYHLIVDRRLDPAFWTSLDSMASPLWTALLILMLFYLTVVDTIRARRDRAKVEQIEAVLAEYETRFGAL